MANKMYNKTKERFVIGELSVAVTIRERLKGLIPRPSLGAEEGMLIPHCNAIHTFLMRYPIDCYFLDKEYRVVSISRNVGPYWFAFGWPGSKHVLEVASLRETPLSIDKNDILEVKETS